MKNHSERVEDRMTENQERKKTQGAGTYYEIRRSAAKTLRDAGIEDAETDGWLLFSYVTGFSKSEAFLRQQEQAPEAVRKTLAELIRKRASHTPVQYLIGEAWCYGNTFYVDEHVLIPRLDTEILIEQAQKRLKPGMRLLDLCTGSGCVLISLLLAVEDLHGAGSDVSEDALAVARRNLEQYDREAQLLCGDLFEPVEGKFDVITANPPYIPSSVVDSLSEEVREHEPRLALDGGEDGLSFYRRIVREAPTYLNDGGVLLIEIGYDQGDALRSLLAAHGYCEIEIVKDLAGLDRVAIGRADAPA